MSDWVIFDHQERNYTAYHGDKKLYKKMYFEEMNRIGDVIVSVLVMSAVVRGFEVRSVKPKDYKICIYKDWLVLNRDKVSEWSDKSNRGLVLVS